jgi:hypothetical protein
MAQEVRAVARRSASPATGGLSVWHQSQMEAERVHDGDDGRQRGIGGPCGKETSNDLGSGTDASNQRGLAGAVRDSHRIERLHELVNRVDLGDDFPVVRGDPRLFQATVNIRVEAGLRTRVWRFPGGASHTVP